MLRSATTRLRVLIGLGCAAGVFLSDTPAEAFSCAPLPWEDEEAYRGTIDGAAAVPVDASLWERRSCAEELSEPEGCRLVRDGETIAVDVDASGLTACDAGLESPGETFPEAVIHYLPARALTPGQRYALECDAGPPARHDGGDRFTIAARSSAGPSTPPESLADVQLEFVRGDDSCCGVAEHLELRIDPETPFLREGGYIRVFYDDGTLMAVDEFQDNGAIWLPATREEFALTPVAADGTRGVSVYFDPDDLDRELVYIPCAVSQHASPLPLWLLAPLLWIRFPGRRRRVARGGA